MSLYIVGLTMISPTYDYSRAYAALKHLNGRKISNRIWLCKVDESKSATIFDLLTQCLAKEDKMLVELAPPHMLFDILPDHTA